MIQPHPEEEGWEVKRSRELEDRKLFALHTENQRLAAQQDEFEVVIADYAHKIDAFNENSRQLEELNKELKAQVETLSTKWTRAEEALAKRNQEYCALYNYLFTERRGTMQEAFLKEIDLSHRLSDIQHESDSQIIAKLRETIKAKDEELLRQGERMDHLNASLISSSFEYQQQINTLKSEKARLCQPSQQTSALSPLDGVTQYCLQKKIETLEKQIVLLKLELQSSKIELKSSKKSMEASEMEKALLEGELNTLKNHLSTFDGSAFSIITENNFLKDQISIQRERSEQFERNYPEIMRNLDGLNHYLSAKAVQAKLTQQINSLKRQNQSKKEEIGFLKIQLQTSIQAKIEVEAKYDKLKVISTSSFQKLKDVISTYVPYHFRKCGLENYNLDKEEEEFIAQRNVEKTLREAYQEIHKKAAELIDLKQKESSALKVNNQQLQTIRQLQSALASKQHEIAVLAKSVESLIQSRSSQASRHQYEADDSQIVNEDEEIGEPADSALVKGDQIKIATLEKAIQEFQEDRRQLVDIIKDKDRKMAQLAADIKVLSATSHITTVNIQAFPEARAAPAPERREQPTYQESPHNLQLSEVREQLKRISAEHRLERQMIVREHEQRETFSLNKYLNLLKRFDELTAKHSALEASIASNPAPETHSEDQNQSSLSEPLEMPEVQPNRDQTALSESAIESFTDTLKKYEKEFNRFVAIYEAQMKKSMESSISEPHDSEADSQPRSEDHSEKLQNLLIQHHDTINNLERLLEQKNQESELIVTQLKNQLEESKEELRVTTEHLQRAEAAVSDLKTQVLTEKCADFTSSESANTAFVILHAKNKQIHELKTALDSARKLYEEKSKEAARLRTEVKGSVSQIEVEEYRLFREIMEEQDLAGVLEAAARRLE